MKTYHKRKQNRKRNTKKSRKRSKKGGGDRDTDIAFGFNNIENMYKKNDGFLNKISRGFKRLYINLIKYDSNNARLPEYPVNSEYPVNNHILRNNNVSIEELGTGGFSSVELWKNISDKNDNPTLYAVKIQKYKNNNDNDYKTAINEAKILSYLKKDNKCLENILCFKGIYIDESYIYLATDYEYGYMDLKNVLNIIIDYTPIENKNENEILNIDKLFIIILNKIFVAVDQLHKMNICHNDLKPDNILCLIPKNDKNLYDIYNSLTHESIKIKIIDFGNSVRFDDTNTIKLDDINATPEYTDPIKYIAYLENNTKNIINKPYIEKHIFYSELMTKNNYNNKNYYKCDYWSLGIIYIQIIEIINNIGNENYVSDLYFFQFEEKTNFEEKTKKKKFSNPDTLSAYNTYSDEYSIFIDDISKQKYKGHNAGLFNLFKIFKKKSDQYYNYVKQTSQNMVFAKIEDLLNPNMDERKITYIKSQSE